MYQLEEVSEIVSKELNNYHDTFHALVGTCAQLCSATGQNICPFFVDIASFMNGSWFIWAELENVPLPEFREFDWYEILDLDENSHSEEYLESALNESYKVGYLWLTKQLGLAKHCHPEVQIEFYHNGSFERQLLELD